jgi:thiol-disulfide isomerase/thioredoxin
MKTHSLLLIFIILIASCNNEDKTEQNRASTTNKKNLDSVYISFKNIPEPATIKAPNGTKSQFFKNVANIYLHPFEDELINMDSINHQQFLFNIEENTELNIEDTRYEYYSLLITPGDSVSIDFNNYKPQIIINNNEINLFDLKKPDSLSTNYSSFTKYKYPVPFLTLDFKSYISPKEQIKKYTDSVRIAAIKEIQTLQNNFQQYLTATKLDKSYVIHFNKRQEIKLEMLEKRNKAKNDFFDFIQKNDNYIHINYFRRYLLEGVEKIYQIPIIKTASGSTPDYRVLLDRIIMDTRIPEKSSEFLLSKCIDNIFNYGSIKEKYDYWLKYKIKIKNKKYIEKFKLRYPTFNFEKETTEKKENIVLYNINKEKTNLEDVINSKDSQLYLIDFWASWCAPCIKNFAESKKMTITYKKSELSILYLSIDKNFKNWLSSSSQYELGENSFLWDNEIDFMKRFKIESIPRYILINKDLKVLHDNAASPGSSELKKLIDKHLISKTHNAN